jgi:hypothetical protein
LRFDVCVRGARGYRSVRRVDDATRAKSEASGASESFRM